MKKAYEPPFVELERFDFEDMLTNSGIGAGDGVLDTLDDTPTDEPIG